MVGNLHKHGRSWSMVASAILLFSLLTGCQSAREIHYFKSEGNYYRLRLNEKSFASKARYLCGYFDEDAVSKYFSEMSQPDSAKVVEWLAHPGENSTLVMILSTNSNAISEQIGALASNEELFQTVAKLANKEKIDQGNAVNTEITATKSLATSLAATADSYFAGATEAELPTLIKDFLTVLQARTRNKLTINNIETANNKYNP